MSELQEGWYEDGGWGRGGFGQVLGIELEEELMRGDGGGGGGVVEDGQGRDCFDLWIKVGEQTTGEPWLQPANSARLVIARNIKQQARGPKAPLIIHQ